MSKDGGPIADSSGDNSDAFTNNKDRFLLSVDCPERMKWFDSLLEVNGEEFDSACRGVLKILFGFLEVTMITRSSSETTSL